MNVLNVGVAGVAHVMAAVCILSGFVATWFSGRRAVVLAGVSFGAGGVLLIAEGVARAILTRRAPVVGAYENTLVAAAMVAVACVVVLLLAAPSVRLTLARLVGSWALLAMAFGSRFSSVPVPLGVEGRGALAYAHAFVGWLDFVVLLVAMMSAAGALAHRGGDASAWETITARMLGAGFVLLTATMASGAFLSFAVFGVWYQWQIVETLAASLWLLYGLALHAYLMFGWRTKRLAILTITALPIVLAVFWSWSLYSGTYHYFERALGS